MAKFDLTGEGSQMARDLYFVPPDAYEGVITKIDGPRETMGYDGNGSKMKAIFTCEIPNSQGKIIPLQMWVVLTVTKGSVSKSGKRYSNSKLYDVLNKAGLVDEIEKFAKNKSAEGEIPDEELMSFLKEHLIGRTAKFDVETSTTKEGEEYSRVKDIKRFMDIEREVEEVDMTEKGKGQKTLKAKAN